jgi:hypothetical protein
MKSKKAKRGRPIVGNERKEAYLVHLEPAQAQAIRGQFGGPTGSLTRAICEMHERLTGDAALFDATAHAKTALKTARRLARAQI